MGVGLGTVLYSVHTEILGEVSLSQTSRQGLDKV